MSIKNRRKNRAQMITIMGIILAISIFIISSLAAEIANIDFVVSSGESTSLSTEFKNIKDTFVVALNYNLVDIDIDGTNESHLSGDIDDIGTAFNKTKDEYFTLYFQYGMLFDASLNDFWCSHYGEIQGENVVFYWVKITLSLDDGISHITENIKKLIVCTPEM